MDIVIQEIRFIQLSIGHPYHFVLWVAEILRETGEFPFVEVNEKFKGARSVAHVHVFGVGCNADNSGTRKTSKVLVLVLLADKPGDQITTGSLSTT